MCSRLFVAISVLLTAASGFAAETVPPVVTQLETQIRDVIDHTEPSVVAVVVSHSEHYAQVNATERARGKLDGYAPPERNPLELLPRHAPELARLDLSNPANIADHLYGSGIVLDAANGLILTTYHLIDGATKVYVRSATGAGSYANLHAADCRSDLAVLKLIHPVPGLQPIHFADVRVDPFRSDKKPTVQRGTWVIAMGHPLAASFADGKPSASWGIISNVRRKANGPEREEQRTHPLTRYGTLLQTDARVTLGCSGGVLLNIAGEAIGLTTPVAAVAGPDLAGGLAIPFDENYRRIIAVLQEGREVDYGFLGISIDSSLIVPGSRQLGLRIGQVTPGTPADHAGLRGFGNARFSDDGDIITAIDGHPVRDQDDLFLYLGAALAGHRVRLTVSRAGVIRHVEVELAKYDNTMPWIASKPAPAIHGLRPDYISVLFLQLQRAGDAHVLRVGLPAGVLVRELVPGSPAATQFQKLGVGAHRWMVTHVNGKPVHNPAEFYEQAGTGKVRLTVIDPTEPTPTHEITLPGS
ncbi:MAG: trypsin-like peptidase domain-containing protein [Bacteroidales bacterium]|nr:trypsin-like peptidase domain-containing protein [Bacteroidales bacterium]